MHENGGERVEVSGTLFVVATPIGNLEDITQRAARVLREVDCIACEDTRISRRLLDHLGINKPLLSYYYPREASKMGEILERLRAGQRVALITDSGTPALSDPGAALVRAAHAEGFRVEPIPGPCAAAAAFSASGFESSGFHFAGFLPEKRSERLGRMQELARMQVPVILYLAPHDVARLLEEIEAAFGDREILLARELTKKFEEVRRTSVTALRRELPEAPRGEFVLVIAPGPVPGYAGEKGIADRFRELIESGLSRGRAIKMISQERSLPKRRIEELLGETGE